MTDQLQEFEKNVLVDPFKRQISYLRLSVTDRCDLRCTYCMPEKMTFLNKKEVLSFEEMYKLCSAFIHLGIKKIRITGGEPLVRKGIMDFFAMLKPHLSSHLEELTITTNGTQLHKYASQLYANGVRRINISLDTLDPKKFKKITRIGNLQDVLLGVQAAQDANLKIKINCVALKNINDDEIDKFIDWCIKKGFDLTFIETMPMGDIGNETRLSHFLSLEELKKSISSKFKLEDISFSSGGPAKYCKIEGSNIKLGFITPLSHNFCASCNRIRLDATGVLHQCLGQSNSLDFRKILRDQSYNKTVLLENIKKSIGQKPEKHSFAYDFSNEAVEGTMKRHMSLTGG
ncbi:MAG: GTP 3',8-cyclase MoaA [Candidatus Endolissoclinum sp. TMED37]|nr:MAG: GTP 3',8-cyclase MoaA [Candidatus Endolissoclinum sp. TMED37]